MNMPPLVTVCSAILLSLQIVIHLCNVPILFSTLYNVLVIWFLFYLPVCAFAVLIFFLFWQKYQYSFYAAS